MEIGNWKWDDGSLINASIISAPNIVGCAHINAITGFGYTQDCSSTSSAEFPAACIRGMTGLNRFQADFVFPASPFPGDSCLSVDHIIGSSGSTTEDRACVFDNTTCPNAVTPFGGRSCDHIDCTKCIECVPGEYMQKECTAYEPSICLPCPSGTFTESSNQLECQEILQFTCDGEFEYEVIPATNTSNVVCANHTECLFDEFQSAAPTNTTDR